MPLLRKPEGLTSIDSQFDYNDPCPSNAEQACDASSSIGPHYYTVYANAERPPRSPEELRVREVLQQPLLNPESETVYPTPITATYSDLYIPHVRESVYLSAIVTGVHAMVTKTPDTGTGRGLGFDAAEAAHKGTMPVVPMMEVQKVYTVPAGGVVVALSDEKEGYDEILENEAEDEDDEATEEDEAVEIRMWEGQVAVTIPDETAVEKVAAEAQEWKARQDGSESKTGSQDNEEISDHVIFCTDETDPILDAREAQPALRDMGKVKWRVCRYRWYFGGASQASEESIIE
jgi:hypothetical protein